MKKLPNSSHCFVCGLENDFGLHLSFYMDEENRVNCETHFSAHFQGYPGVVHGGVVAAALDETLARAVMVDDPDRFMFTGKLTTRYRRPVPTEQPIRLVGEVLNDRGRVAECAAKLYGPEGELLAEAEGLMMGIPEGMVDHSNQDGFWWGVVDD
ncbi:MAG TPA: PaaI family thioesterase [Anaerolineales bacterium]|nr:PaaI family thioesterase [Anaerolineales bacterium]